MPDPVTALIILTAGRSSRMGEPKALLRFGRQTTLELAVENACRAGIQHVVAVVGHRAEEIRAAHVFSGLPLSYSWAVNLEEDSPMVCSLQAGLRELENIRLDGFFFQPVDLPLIGPADLTRLLNAFSRRQASQQVFIPSFANRRGHPVLCDIALVPEFLALGPHQSPRDVLELQKIVYVETENPGVLEDMDTRDDYQRLKAIYEGARMKRR